MLDALFKPKSIAVLGASEREFNIGNRIVKNLVEYGYKGAIYPINTKVDTLYGQKTYPSILDVPTDVDVVHVAIAARHVPQAIDDCGTKNVKYLIMNGGGFSEIGPVGAAIEADCMARAKKHGIRIFGPNCQGIINSDPEVKAYCNFTFTFPKPGGVSVLALSGGVASLLHQAIYDMGIGTRMYASNGNAVDISIPELLEYFGNDEGTKVIILYVEGIRDPKEFLRVAREVAAKKPILVMKAGRTMEGAKAAASHTGGLAKEDLSADLIFEKAGMLCFYDEMELCQAAATFASQPIPQGGRVGMITNTGGPAVIATDAMAQGGLTIPPISAKTEEILKASLFPEASVHNPVDVLATGTAQHFRLTLDTMMDDDGIDSVLLHFVTPPFVDTDSIAKEIVEVNKQRRKPLICNLMTDKGQWQETVRILTEGEVVCYDFPSTCGRILAALTKYGQIRSREESPVKNFNDVDRQKAEAILKEAGAAGRKQLSADEVYGVLSAYGIPIADCRIAGNPDEAARYAAEIGFPVVLKADAASIIHKTDLGGVALNLADEKAVREEAEQMTTKLSGHNLKFLVQKYLPAGKEIIVGAKADDEVGHLVMAGLGGVYVDIFKDINFKLAPVTMAEAESMLSSLKAAPILAGVRGEKAVNREAVIEIIQRVSQLVTELPAIQEMDLNPVLASDQGAVVVDARINM